MAYCPPQYAPHYYYPTPAPAPSHKTSYYEDTDVHGHESLACEPIPQYVSYIPPPIYVHVPLTEDPFAPPCGDNYDDILPNEESCPEQTTSCCQTETSEPCATEPCAAEQCDETCDETCDQICDEPCDETCDQICDETPKDTFILRVPRHKRPKLVINDTNHGHMGRHLHIDQYGNILSHSAGPHIHS